MLYSRNFYFQVTSKKMRLVMLYLIDSIVKNVGDEYIRHFSKNLVKNFAYVFENVSLNKTVKFNFYNGFHS